MVELSSNYDRSSTATLPRRRLVGALIAAASLIGVLALMSSDLRSKVGVVSGVMLILVASFGIMLALGRLDSQPGARSSVPIAELEKPLFLLFVAALAVLSILSLAVRGTISSALASLAAPIAFLAAVVALDRVGRALGVLDDRPLLKRTGFWVVALATGIGLPLLGAPSLTDPWETHYGEVAREMLARGDFISTWWGHEGWFMTKPVLSFWLQALSMSALGMRFEAGQMLTAGAHPEWAVRVPSFVFSLVGSYLLYRGVAACAGRRAGFLGALVLWTSSQWVMISHQSMTDTPFVGALAAAMGLLLLAFNTAETDIVRRYEVRVAGRTLSFDAGALVLTLLLLCALPQILYLVSQHVELNLRESGRGIRFVGDSLFAGSKGNCGLAGQPACTESRLAYPRLTPALQALTWTALLVYLVPSIAREHRTRRLLLLSAWIFAAIATVGKGAAGFALPLGVAVLTLVADRRYKELFRSEIVRGPLILVLLVVPWYVAMVARHGRAIFDELVMRHMIGRTLEHLHDTNFGDDVSFRYYLWQLGYALFPWIGLLPAALWSALARREERSESAVAVRHLLVIWAIVAFSLFTIMRTKFHHYILPTLPALAMLVGIWLDERLSERHERRASGLRLVLVLGGAILLVRVGLDLILTGRGDVAGPARLVHLFTYQYRRAWPEALDFSKVLAIFTVLIALAMLAAVMRRFERRALAAHAMVAIAFAIWLVGVYLPRVSPHWGQREVIEAFYRDRSGPNEALVAYQMNWKGENFYTGNHLEIFVSSGPPFQRYLERRRAERDPIVHVVLPHDRLDALKSELGKIERFDRLTDDVLNNKFCLVRVQL